MAAGAAAGAAPLSPHRRKNQGTMPRVLRLRAVSWIGGVFRFFGFGWL